jgi:S-formylglutathione hydrolase FrmB
VYGLDVATRDDDSAAPSRRPAVRLILLVLTALTGAGVIAALVLGGRNAASSHAAGGGATTAGGTTVDRTAGDPDPSGTTSCSSGATGPLRDDTRFAASGGAVVPFGISLPADYYRTCRTYPVLYVLHGKNQNSVDFMDSALRMRRAMDVGALDQAIIVTPDGFSTSRWENTDAGPAEDNFIRFLIPYVERTYRVEPGPSHRLLAGFSMGGHGALRFGLKYPQLFAGVWSVDGAMSRKPTDYLPLVTGKSSRDVHIIAVGGQDNGSRVQAAVETLKQAGITIPYTYRDREHTFDAFVEEDEKAGWPAARFLQQQLHRSH